METGELKTLVIGALREIGEASVSDVLTYVKDVTGKDYAYTTIATILRRLDKEDIISGTKKRKEGTRKKTYYSINDDAHKYEANNFLKEYIEKFGEVGIRHLGDLMGNTLDEAEIDELRKRIHER